MLPGAAEMCGPDNKVELGGGSDIDCTGTCGQYSKQFCKDTKKTHPEISTIIRKQEGGEMKIHLSER